MRTTIVVRSKTLLADHSSNTVDEEMLCTHCSNISVLHENIFALHNNISHSAGAVIYTVTKHNRVLETQYNHTEIQRISSFVKKSFRSQMIFL